MSSRVAYNFVGLFSAYDTAAPPRKMRGVRPTGRARIGVNASIVGESPSGLGLYSIKLARQLDRLREDLLIYTSAPETLGALRACIERIPAGVRPERGLRGHFMRLMWTQSALRVRARAHRLKVLLNTVPEGVLGLPIPQVAVVHDLLPLFFSAEYPRHQYYFRFLVPRILRASHVVVADSERRGGASFGTTRFLRRRFG